MTVTCTFKNCHFCFRYDFELFNYSLRGYLELGKPDKDPSTLLEAINMKEVPRPAPEGYTFSDKEELTSQKLPNHAN